MIKKIILWTRYWLECESCGYRKPIVIDEVNRVAAKGRVQVEPCERCGNEGYKEMVVTRAEYFENDEI